MFPKQQIDGFKKYWRRRKPSTSTALHYASDVRIFFIWAQGKPAEAITVHNVDEFIGWQQRATKHYSRVASHRNGRPPCAEHSRSQLENYVFLRRPIVRC